jgi:acyl-CoA thioesterase FadM
LWNQLSLQCDHIVHRNFKWFTGKLDEGSWQLLSAAGLTRAHFSKENGEIAAVEQPIEDKRGLYAGDIVTVPSAVLEVNEKATRLRHQMMSDEM